MNLSHRDHYSVSLASVEVGNSVLQLSSGEEVIVDSGTTLAYLPNSVCMPLMNEVNAIIIFFLYILSVFTI